MAVTALDLFLKIARTGRPYVVRNPLVPSEHVLVCPERVLRPWQGAISKAPQVLNLPQHDSNCYLCPDNLRVSGRRNPAASKYPFAFPNDFSAILPPLPGEVFNQTVNKDGVTYTGIAGICEVIVFTPRHHKNLQTMTPLELEAVGRFLQKYYASKIEDTLITFPQIFINKWGNSLPHEHCQVWNTNEVPPRQQAILDSLDKYFSRNKKHFFKTLTKAELRDKIRIIFENQYFLAIVAPWAEWPYEVTLFPKEDFEREHKRSIADLNSEELSSFMEAYVAVEKIYNDLFNEPFRYCSGFYQAPTDGGHHPAAQFFVEFRSDILRHPSIPKHKVGFELTAMPQRDMSPEFAAICLKLHLPPHLLFKALSIQRKDRNIWDFWNDILVGKIDWRGLATDEILEERQAFLTFVDN